MEGLIRYLPGIFIFLFLIKKLIDYIKLDLESSVPQNETSTSNQSEYNQEVSEEKVKDMIEEQVSDDLQQETIDKNSGKEERLEENSDSLTAVNHIKNKGISLKNKDREKKSSSHNQLQELLGEKLEKKEVIRGMIYKQILDKPRAKNPYKHKFFS